MSIQQHLKNSQEKVERAENESETKIEPFPMPSEKCFSGLAGEFVNKVAPHSEGSKIALLIQLLIFFGVIIGRKAHFTVEADEHFTNLFSVLIGDTAAGRKGTSFGRVKQMFRGVDERFDLNGIVSGLASGEGLIYHVRDAVEEIKKDKKTGKVETIVIDNGVSDKRLLVYEGEFAQILRVQKRETNTLSPVLRTLWDIGDTRNLVKNSPLRTTNAHVSIVAHITKTEFVACLDEIEAANGGLNRYLFICVRRSQFLPFGGDLPPNALNELREKLKERIKFAGNVEQMNFTPDAALLWAQEYRRLETSRTGFLAKVTQRASPYVLRLSCIFALLDGQAAINLNHLEAALAVWKYSEDSAKYIFGNRTGDKLTDEILIILQRAAKAGISKTEIANKTGRNYAANRLNAALQNLYEQGLATFRRETRSGSKKPVEIWIANEFNELNEVNQSDGKTNSSNSLNSYPQENQNKSVDVGRQLMDATANNDDRAAMLDSLVERTAVFIVENGWSETQATQAAEADLLPRWLEQYGAR